MKRILILIMLYCFCQMHGYGQNSKYQFAKGVFKNSYKKQQFAKFNGKVERIDERTFRYGEKILNIDAEDKSVMTIFSQGIFHPDIIGGKETIKALTKTQLDTMSIESQLFYNLSRNDSLRMEGVEELRKLNPNAKTKRFVFWLYQKGMANPTECYFELYNGRGTEKMTLKEFISGSILTFYHRGTIII
jgi:hypothetical protein